MSLTAKQLSKSGAKGKELDTLVREQLHMIDDHLQRSERTWGANVVVYDLPTTFVFPGLDKKDAQRIVYTAVIKSLQERGFEVRLLLNPERTALYIKWVTDLNSAEIGAMNRLITEVRIAPGAIEGFLSGTARRGGPEPPPAI
jgi:hypothetical protein